MKTKKVFIICRSALIAALYFILSIAVPSISFGTIQFRISEALTLLPVIMPEAIFGLTVGCFFANMFFSPFGILDMAIGTSVTFIASILTYLLRKHIAVSAIPPVILNALFVPLIWIIDGTDTLYYINMFSILISQTIVIYAIGLPLTIGLKKVLPVILSKTANLKTKKGLKTKTDDIEGSPDADNADIKSLQSSNSETSPKTSTSDDETDEHCGSNDGKKSEKLTSDER